MVVHLVPHGHTLLQELAAALAVHLDAPVHEVCLAVVLKELAQVMEEPRGGCEDGSILPPAWAAPFAAFVGKGEDSPWTWRKPTNCGGR